MVILLLFVPSYTLYLHYCIINPSFNSSYPRWNNIFYIIWTFTMFVGKYILKNTFTNHFGIYIAEFNNRDDKMGKYIRRYIFGSVFLKATQRSVLYLLIITHSTMYIFRNKFIHIPVFLVGFIYFLHRRRKEGLKV